MCELAEKFYRLLVICSGRINLLHMQSQRNIFVMEANDSPPLPTLGIEGNALVSASVRAPHSSICSVLALVALAEIKFAAVKAIVISVIDKYKIVRRAEHEAMQMQHYQRSVFISVGSLTVKSLGVRTPLRVPLIFRNALKILFIDNGKLSSRQRNLAGKITVFFKEWECHGCYLK